jgi:hypothetical protein
MIESSYWTPLLPAGRGQVAHIVAPFPTAVQFEAGRDLENRPTARIQQPVSVEALVEGQRGIDMKQIPTILTLAAVLLVALPAAAVRLWNHLEQGAYRSPMSVATEMLTPRERRLQELAAAGASQAASAVKEQPVASLIFLARTTRLQETWGPQRCRVSTTCRGNLRWSTT